MAIDRKLIAQERDTTCSVLPLLLERGVSFQCNIVEEG